MFHLPEADRAAEPDWGTEMGRDRENRRWRRPGSKQALVALVSLTASWCHSAGAQFDISEVRPEAGVEVPSNVRAWIHAEGEYDDTIPVEVSQGANVRSLEFRHEGDGVLAVALSPLDGGQVELVVARTGDDPVVLAYSAAVDEDSSPPVVGAPIVSAEPASASDPDAQGFFVHVDPGELSDDWGVASVAFEFDDQGGTPYVGASGEPAFVVEHRALLEEASSGWSHQYVGSQSSACARVTVWDVAGNETTSEPTCVELRHEGPDWLKALLEATGCSCVVSDRKQPLSGLALVLAFVVAGRAFQRASGRRRRMD